MTCFKNSLSKGSLFRSFYIKLFFVYSLYKDTYGQFTDNSWEKKRHSASDIIYGVLFSTVLWITASKKHGWVDYFTPLAPLQKKVLFNARDKLKNDHELIRKRISGDVFFFSIREPVPFTISIHWLLFYWLTHTCTNIKSHVTTVATLPSLVTAVTYSYKQPHRVRKLN